MALMKPIPKTTSAFDGNYEYTFYFDVPSGGNQVQKNRMVIKDNITNLVCYDETVNSYSYEHTYIPSNATEQLVNGRSYKVCFVTYDINDNTSSTVEDANYILFYCYSTPSLSITNIPSNNKIESVSFNFNILYEQEENEKLKEYTVKLYNDFGKEISEKKVFTTESTNQWLYSGFDNNTNYKIKVFGITEYGTNIESELYEFLIVYEQPSLYSLIKLENNCNNGYIEINSNLIIIEGSSNYTIKYKDNKLDLGKLNQWLKWNDGFEVPSNFTMEIWLELDNLGNLCVLNNSSTEQLTLSLERSNNKDYLVLKDNQNKLRISSNKVDILGGGSKLVAWFVKNNDEYTLLLDVIERINSVADWNSNSSSIFYNEVTNISYKDESNSNTETYVDDYNYDPLTELYPLNSITLINGLYDHFNISKISESGIVYPHTDGSEWNYKPEWNYYTIVDCDFNNNVNGGNLNRTLDSIDYINVLRREQGEVNWNVICKRKIEDVYDLQLNIRDFFCPSNKIFEYAVIPIAPDGSEGEYKISSIESKFNGIFIVDKDQTFKLFSGIAFSDTTRNKEIGTVNPIGRKYPIIIENSYIDYLTGGVTGRLLGYDFEKNRSLDRYEIVQHTNDFSDFLVNGKCKIIKDWNGNIWVARLSQPPTITYEQTYGNGITQVSFSWIEQGKWNSQEDLEDNGLV